MPNWKKVITSGSNAELNDINLSGHITASGNISASGAILAKGFQVPNNDNYYISSSLAEIVGFEVDPSSPTNIAYKLGSSYHGGFFSLYAGGSQRISLHSTTDSFINTGFDFGIGTSSPSSKLEVNGDITATNITASGNISASATSTGSFGHVMIGGSNIKTFISSSAAADGFGSGGGGGDGDIEGVTAGTGMTGGGDSGAVTLNVIGGNGITANANDMAITAAQTTITSVTNTGLKVGRGTSDTYIDFGTDDKIKLKPANATALEVETGGVDVTGAITSSGNISASGNAQVNQITASAFQFIGSGTAELEVEGHITASGNISASGIVTAEGLVISDDATITDDLTVSGQIELGHASDTTLTRASSGNVNIEGNLVYRAGGTDVPVADGGTGASTLTDGGVLLGSGTSAITAMSVLSDGEMIVGDGSGDPVAESGATLRTSIGVGAANNVIFNHITASGNISASGGNFEGNFFVSNGVNAIGYTTNNSRVNIGPNNTTSVIIHGPVTASGNISSSGNILAPIKAQKNTPTINYGTGAELTPNANDYSGEVIYDGNDSTDAGKIYYSNNGTWTATDADAAATSTGLIAVALGSNSTTHGMLLRGMVKLDHDPGGNIGVALYLSVTAGQASNSAPTGNNDIARVIGYNLGSSGEIYFNPDNTWVEVNA